MSEERWHEVANVRGLEARIEALEKHKRLQMEDVMNLGAALGQAQVRIEALEAALIAEREACAAIAAKRPHHSGIEIAELIRQRSRHDQHQRTD
jgi:uncharacterized coiled-coil protein SlyX